VPSDLLSTDARCLVIILGGQCNRLMVDFYRAICYAKRGTCRHVSVRPSVCLQIMPHDRPGTIVIKWDVVAEFLLTSASRGPSAITEPLVNFGCPIHISEMAEARALKLCTKGDYIKSGQRDDK